MGMTRSEILAVVKNIKSTTPVLDDRGQKLAICLYAHSSCQLDQQP